MRKHEEVRRLRRSHYVLIIALGLAIAAGRIATVISPEGSTAFLSANDRSRWSTVAALVEDGTFAIDRQQRLTDHKGRRVWQSIDRVQHRGADGKQHDYSSKPPLLPVMIAGIYGTVRLISGMTLTEHPVYVARIVLALVNLPLLALFYIATIGCVERIAHSDWARRTAAVMVTFATMVLPFAITLNNHLPAAAATAAVAYIYLMMSQRLDDDFAGDAFRPSLTLTVTAGLLSGFVAANELPALTMVGLWGVLFFLLDRRTLPGYCLGVGIVAVAFFGANWWAHQSLRPAYAHRGVGAQVATVSAVPRAERIESLTRKLREVGEIDDRETIELLESAEPQRMLIRTSGQRKFALRSTSATHLLDEASQWEIRRWDDWYEYPGSYWQTERAGVDRGEPSRAVYLFHATIGHYGIFSITPIWLLVPWSLARSGKFRDREQRYLMLAILIASAVCFTFYLSRPQIDRNYGGVSVCFRWMLWFAPLWLIAMMPLLDYLANTDRGKWLVVVLVVGSVFSVSTALASPWQSPWIYRYWQFLGWLGG